jgi:Domain of unknown function (DUF4214)
MKMATSKSICFGMKFVLTALMLFFLCSPAWAALTKTEISQLYVAIFGRASEGEGNNYWRTTGFEMATTANVMLETDAAKNYFGTSLNSNQAFIEHIYANTLNKTQAQDPSGIIYWVSLLNSGRSRGDVVASLVGAIKNYAPGGPYYNPDDSATVAAYNQFTNRVTISDYLSDTVLKAPADWATSTKFALGGLNVTNDEASVVAAKNIVNSMVAKIPDTGQITHYTNVFGEDSDYTINPPSYTKLDAKGNVLPESATTWAMVRDNVTGLIWENKANKDGAKDYSIPMMPITPTPGMTRTLHHMEILE